MESLGVFDVLDRDRRGFVPVVVGLHVTEHDLGQRGAQLDAGNFYTEHGASMRPGQSRVSVRADRSRLRRPEHVDDPGGRHHAIVALDESERDFVRNML